MLCINAFIMRLPVAAVAASQLDKNVFIPAMVGVMCGDRLFLNAFVVIKNVLKRDCGASCRRANTANTPNRRQRSNITMARTTQQHTMARTYSRVPRNKNSRSLTFSPPPPSPPLALHQSSCAYYSSADVRSITCYHARRWCRFTCYLPRTAMVRFVRNKKIWTFVFTTDLHPQC